MKQSLPQLAIIANSAHVAGERASLKGIEHFRQAGEALIAAKALCGHGKWLAWLEKNVRFSQRQANSYMRLAKLEVTSDLPEQWKVISGNAADDEDATPREPGPFIPSDQQQQILDWLMRRRDSWPEKFRAMFIGFVRQALGLMEESSADDRGQGAHTSDAEASAA